MRKDWGVFFRVHRKIGEASALENRKTPSCSRHANAAFEPNLEYGDVLSTHTQPNELAATDMVAFVCEDAWFFPQTNDSYSYVPF